MKLPAVVKIGLATAVATWASPKINAMVTTTNDIVVLNDEAIPDAPDMIIPFTAVTAAFVYTALSLMFGGEAATVKDGKGAS